ncbi:MAG: hypothetical protein ACRBN8_00545 [Nannocystales bacterium]
MQLRSAALFTLLCTVALPGCDKVKQCNSLIDTINSHTPKMTAATGKFAEIATNPAVVEEYEAVVQGAIDEVKALELGDEKVSAFAKRYETLLGDAKTLGAETKAATTDPAKFQAVSTKGNDIRKTEEALVAEVNTYCSS